MTAQQWLYLAFTALLVLVLAGIMIHAFRRKRKDRMEQPKYRMMEDDE